MRRGASYRLRGVILFEPFISAASLVYSLLHHEPVAWKQRLISPANIASARLLRRAKATRLFFVENEWTPTLRLEGGARRSLQRVQLLALRRLQQARAVSSGIMSMLDRIDALPRVAQAGRAMSGTSPGFIRCRSKVISGFGNERVLCRRGADSRVAPSNTASVGRESSPPAGGARRFDIPGGLRTARPMKFVLKGKAF
jgi:hypothetical protein